MCVDLRQDKKFAAPTPAKPFWCPDLPGHSGPRLDGKLAGHGPAEEIPRIGFTDLGAA